MSQSSKEVKRGLEGENAKEEDWEVVSGMKSLPTDASSVTEIAEQKDKKTNMENKDNAKKEPQKNANEAEERKMEEGAKKEVEDWYQTIPPTPMNTPEFTPVPPSYPSAGRKSENQNGSDGTELTPITEEILEDQNQNSTTHQEDGPRSDSDQRNLQNESKNTMVKKAIDLVVLSLSRFAVVFVVYNVFKWVFSKVCEKIRSIKSARSESK